MVKKALSLLLSLTLLLSLVIVPARAESSQDGEQTIKLGIKVQTGNWEYKEFKPTDPSTYYTVTIYAESDFDTYLLNAAEMYLAFDKNKVSYVTAELGKADALNKVYDELLGDVSKPMSTEFSDRTLSNNEGYVRILIFDTSDKGRVIPTNTELATLRFTVNKDIESCEADFSFAVEGKNNIVRVDKNAAHIVDDSATATASIKGITPVLNTVKLNGETTTVNVNGTDGATVNATATSAQGTNLTKMVTWSANPAAGGVGIDATTGTITVGAKAKTGDYTITATPKDGSSQGEAKSATLTVKRAPETYTVTVTPKSMEMTVPASDENKGSFSATVTNQYDETMTGGVTWSISPTNDNVSINSATGEVTVKAEAKNTIEGTTGSEFTVTATYGENKVTDTATLTVKREKSKVSSIELAADAETIFEVPTVDQTGREVPKVADFPAVTVKDQYGNDMSVEKVTWTLGSDRPDGVSIDENDKLVISSVAANDIFTNNELKFTATVSYGGVSKDVTLTLTRELSTATSVEISGGKNEFTIPVDETADEATFTAVVKDQYGQTVTGENATVEWSVTSSVAGVNFNNGEVSVTKDAKNVITNPQEFTVTAKCGNVEATKNFTVKRAAPVVTTVEYTGDTNVVVPDGNGMNECAITLTFKDQYGTVMTSGVDSSKLMWTCPEGITVETGSDTQYSVKVTKDALKHLGNERKNSVEVKITAEYDNLTKEIPVTLKLADAKPTSIVLTSNPTGDDIVIPTGDMPNTKTYTATVKDQYGFVITDENTKVTFSMSPASGVGVTFDEKTGTVSVTKNATAEQSYTVTATCGEATASHKFTVKNKNLHAGKLDVAQANFTYGESGKLNPSATLNGNKVTASYTYTDSNNQGVETTPTNAGTYTVTARYETATDIYTGKTTFTIGQKSLTSDMLTVSGTYTYTGAEQTVNYEVKDGNLLTANDYTITGTKGQNAGTYTVTVTGKGNYTGTVTKTWTITPAELTIESVALENRAYNGEKAVTVKSVTFDSLQNGESLTINTNYTATGMMADANAGENKDVTVTVTLNNTVKNYTLKNGKFESGKVTIAKASHEDVTANMKAKYGNTAELELTTVGLPTGYVLGMPVVDANPADIFDGSMTLSGSSLSAKLTSDATKAGKTATITIPVSSTNYADYTIRVTVTVLAKTAQTLTADAISVKYGDSFTPTVKDAKTNVTYTVKVGSEGLLKIEDGEFVATGVGTARIVASAAETSDYAAATKDITVTIAKRPLTVKADDKTAYVGAEQPELTYTVDGLLKADKATLDEFTLKIAVDEGVDPMKKAGTYDIVFVDADKVAFADDKYDLKTENGTLTVRTRHSSGTTGSTGGVSIDRPENGKVTVSPANPVKGSTVTITVTPNKDQELKSLEVIDQNGNSLPLTDLGNGKFSFVMPEGKVTIKSEFGEANAFGNPYDDVKSGDWYYGAVEYVTVNGLMNGTSKGFEPNLATSRAMVWTILARMSGVNTAGSGEWYAVAQQWAVVNGVSDGTMPNGTITREQLAAMLYRYAVSKGMVKGPATADLSVFADANSVSSYAVEAMQWAVSTGLISGMDGKLNPQGSATRAQVATMLMRFAEMAK